MTRRDFGATAQVNEITFPLLPALNGKLPRGFLKDPSNEMSEKRTYGKWISGLTWNFLSWCWSYNTGTYGAAGSSRAVVTPYCFYAVILNVLNKVAFNAVRSIGKVSDNQWTENNDVSLSYENRYWSESLYFLLAYGLLHDANRIFLKQWEIMSQQWFSSE